ncbi:hypothetical protein [Vagococcus hydrophili]|uniref:Resolvase HTH domain-containing protein n=1 Tax=Vagococcus hydrophili TaxID=2714947 RepID=A0A6G8ATH8_9ENTE|nr:hypothetical protein [Vagococcus hydrophili]QIL48297.1 hypothetical protein G7082_07235 [Vagococcus hydrophili]
MEYGYLKSIDGQVMNMSLLFTRYSECDVVVDPLDSTENLDILLGKLEEKDTVIIYDLVPLVIGMNNLEKTVRLFKEMSIRLIVIDSEIDTAKEEHCHFYDNLTCYINSRRQAHSLVNKSILRKRKEQGLVNGRPVVDDEVVAKINYLRQAKKMKYREIAEACQVSIGTVCKYLERGS